MNICGTDGPFKQRQPPKWHKIRLQLQINPSNACSLYIHVNMVIISVGNLCQSEADNFGGRLGRSCWFYVYDLRFNVWGPTIFFFFLVSNSGLHYVCRCQHAWCWWNCGDLRDLSQPIWIITTAEGHHTICSYPSNDFQRFVWINISLKKKNSFTVKYPGM